LNQDNLPRELSLPSKAPVLASPQTPQPPAAPTPEQIRRSRRIMALLFLFFALPVIASYFTYYVIKPQGRTNYGELVDPQRNVKALAVGAVQDASAGGAQSTPATLPSELGKIAPLQKKWLLITIGPAVCDEACSKRMFFVRQVRKTTGKEMDRVERVWLMTDEAMPDNKLLAEHAGLQLVRAKAKDLEALFPTAPGNVLSDHVYLVDPLGNLMMRFPKEMDASKMKKDLIKLLKASRIG
jgi:cytochrome oxidase Cu insertion factor (SCO1/SenC/PrrC family)